MGSYRYGMNRQTAGQHQVSWKPCRPARSAASSPSRDAPCLIQDKKGRDTLTTTWILNSTVGAIQFPDGFTHAKALTPTSQKKLKMGESSLFAPDHGWWGGGARQTCSSLWVTLWPTHTHFLSSCSINSVPSCARSYAP